MPENKTSRRPPKLPKAPIRRRNDDTPPPSNWRGVILFAGILAMLGVFFYIHQLNTAAATRDLTMPELVKLLDEKRVKEVSLYTEPSTGISYLTGKYEIHEDELKGQPMPEGKISGFKTDVN